MRTKWSIAADDWITSLRSVNHSLLYSGSKHLFCFVDLDYLTAFGFPKMFYLKHKEKSSICNAFFFYESPLFEASFISGYSIKKVLPKRKDFSLCPRLDSNQHTCWHHPLKMACLPISPTGLTGCEDSYFL